MDLSDKGAHELTLLGMNQLLRKVSTWFKGNPESIQIQLFHSATWSIGAKIYAKNNHYNHSRFSNIAIRMSADELDIYETVDGLCFAKVCNNLIYINYMNYKRVKSNYFLLYSYYYYFV